MNTLYLVRHAEKERKPFPKLSPTGHIQAKKLASSFILRKKYVLFSSPMERALQTAGYIADYQKISITIIESFKERYEFEEVPGRGYQDYLQQISASNLDRNFILPNGMTSEKNASQCLRLLKKLVKENPGKDIIVVSHGGTILDILRTLYTDHELQNFSKELTTWQDIRIPSASITAIELNGDLGRLLQIGTSSPIV